MSVETITDMRTFEDALDEQWCHETAFPGGPTLCGHRNPNGTDHWGDAEAEFCDGCGKRNCPECQLLSPT